MNFLKASKYLSVGRWHMCDYIPKDEIWKHFCTKKDLAHIHHSVQFSQHRRIRFYTFPWLSCQQKSVSPTRRRRWCFGRLVFLFMFWHSVVGPARVNKTLGIGASQTPGTLSATCAVLSPFSRPRRTGTAPHPGTAQSRVSTHSEVSGVNKRPCLLFLTSPTGTMSVQTLATLSPSLTTPEPPPQPGQATVQKCAFLLVLKSKCVQYCSFPTWWTFGWCSKVFILSRIKTYPLFRVTSHTSPDPPATFKPLCPEPPLLPCLLLCLLLCHLLGCRAFLYLLTFYHL